MHTIKNLEQKFVSNTSIYTLNFANLTEKPDSTKNLTAKQVRHDIAAFAQMLINIYGGWPFFSAKIRKNILNKLNEIYENATQTTTAQDLFNNLTTIVQIIPDNHLWIKLGDKVSKYPRPERIDIGENLAKKYGNGKKYFIGKLNNIGIIAFSKCFAPDNPEDMEKFRKLVRDAMTDTDAIIIDMRDNPGGSPTIISMIATELNGTDIVPRCDMIYARTTPQAVELYKYFSLPYENRDLSVDPTIQTDNHGFKLPQEHKFAYNKPIYILQNNRSASSAEHLQTTLRFNPNLKIVGSNSLGCRQHTQYKPFILEHSRIIANISTNYAHVPEIKKFETHGFTPDICVSNGIDAFDVVMAQINRKVK